MLNIECLKNKNGSIKLKYAHTKGFIKKRISADIPQPVYTGDYVYDAHCTVIDFTIGCNI